MDSLSDEEVAYFRNSGQFDEEWYVEEYPDVKMLRMDPARHFLWLGARLGRRPLRDSSLRNDQAGSPTRVVDATAKRSPAALATDQDPRAGLLARSSLLDPEYVCKQLGLPFGTERLAIARAYYSNAGERSLRPNPLFDPEYYRHANELGFHADPVAHYLAGGAREHLRCHFLFDADWYKSQIADAAEADDLLEHYWRVGYPKKIPPTDPSKTEILPEIARLFFANVNESDYDSFDPWIYRLCNPQVAHLYDKELVKHYGRSGKREGRIASVAAYFAKCGALPRFLPIDFSPTGYTDVHLDLAKEFPDGSFACLTHYLSDGLSEGRAYSFTDLYGYFCPNNRHFSVELIEQQEKTPLCVLVHLYYPEMWEELCAYIRNIEVPFDLYVNLVDSTWTPEALRQIRSDFPEAKVYISANAGRDIGGFIRLLDSVDFGNYVAFALIHSKKSPHVTEAYSSRWKESLLQPLFGSPETVAQNVAAFIEDPSIGIIGSTQNRHTSLAKNEDAFTHLLDMYQVDEEHRECEYVSGTMMLVRSELMQKMYEPLKDFDFKLGDGKDLTFHMDGQFEHAVERVFGNVMKQNKMQFLWR